MSKDKIELTEEMVNTLDNLPKANGAFKEAAKKYKGEDVKMVDVFDLPFSVEPSGVISDDHCIASGEFCGTMEQSKAAVHAINSHDTITHQVAELRAALQSVKIHQEKITPSGFEFSSVWQVANKALKESE